MSLLYFTDGLPLLELCSQTPKHYRLLPMLLYPPGFDKNFEVI